MRGVEMNKFVEIAGFDSHLKGDADESLTLVSGILGTKNWTVVGGSAVVFWTHKSVRKVSPDIDILISPHSILALRNSFHEHGWTQENNTLGVTFLKGQFSIDCLLATGRFQHECIEKNQPVKINDAGYIPVIDVEHLLVMKMRANRRKDWSDFVLLAKKHFTEVPKARLIVKKYFPDEVEDFDSLVMVAKHTKD